MRLIDADALTDELQKEIDEIAEEFKRNEALAWERGLRFGLIMAEKMVDEVSTVEMPTVEPQQWIPCSERLPEEDDYHDFWAMPDGAVLWCNDNGEIGVGWNYSGTKVWSDLWGYGVKDVVAWMPLPKPYYEDEESPIEE